MAKRKIVGKKIAVKKPMAKRKIAVRKTVRKAAPARRTPSTMSARAKQALRARWDATLGALTSAQQAAEKQVALLLKRNRIGRDEAAASLTELAARFARERRKLAKQLDRGMKTLEGQVRKQGKSVAHNVGDAVQRALAAFNVPSRREVAELTAKVNALSRKIDNLKRA